MEEDTDQGAEEGYHVCSESGVRFPEQNIRTLKVRWNKSHLRGLADYLTPLTSVAQRD